ncbi:MAG: ORF6N domain-containing protein [Bacteroidetes bacterium]|nr:MAG: ORF6N domain-containing protein [Bacteroidota bacterium]
MEKNDHLPDEFLLNKIYLIRNEKVMLDKDIATLYGVKAIRLREQVKRNKDRFPNSFMFQLTEEEADFMVSQNAIPSKQHMGGYLPYVFTEHGILMLANVLKSDLAIKMSIRIIELFVKFRKMLLTSKDVLLNLEKIEKTIAGYDNNFRVIFEYLKQFERAKSEQLEYKNRKKIGY